MSQQHLHLADHSPDTASVSFVDVAFRLTGNAVPVDHGYALYSALSRILPALHSSPSWAVHRIRGNYTGPGELALDHKSKLTLRAPTFDLPELMHLVGKPLDVGGRSLRIGVPTVLPLRSVANLRAHLCTIKGFTEPEPFAEALRRQLTAMGVCEQVDVALGQRRVLNIKGKRVVGFALAVGGLSADESLDLQVKGVGGRRRFGCGVFVPLGRLPQ